MAKFKIPLESEVAAYMREKMGWPESFCNYYAERFWSHYQASGWKLKGGNSIKDWKACFRSQWQDLKYPADIERMKQAKSNPVKVDRDPKDYVAALDGFLKTYLSRPSEIVFAEFGKFYEVMKEHKLLKPFNKEEVEGIKTVYHNDIDKCRCACVQKTMDWLANSGLTFARMLSLQNRVLNG